MVEMFAIEQGEGGKVGMDGRFGVERRGLAKKILVDVRKAGRFPEYLLETPATL